MIKVRVFVQNLSAERFWDVGKSVPPVKVSTNLNLVGINKKSDELLEVPFVFSINYNPAIAQISIKGRAHILGKKDEIKRILDLHKQKKPPPPMVVQSISNVAFLESVIVSRTLNIPPPIPLPQVPPIVKKKPSEPTYRA